MSANRAPTATRKALLLSVSAAAMLASATSALAQVTTRTVPPVTAPGQDKKLQAFGVLNPTGGDIDPFNGDIDPFWGAVLAREGDIDPFGGDIDPFDGDIDPFNGDIDPFWGAFDPFSHGSNPLNLPAYTAIGSFWQTVTPGINSTNTTWRGLGAYGLNVAGYAGVQTSLTTLIAQSQVLFGPAVTAKTGQSFQAGFVNPLLTKYGIDLANTATLASLTPAQRSMFFLDWYDGLMNYSGADHIDHWMSTVKWRPAITRVQGMGQGTIIGLLDATVAGDPDVLNNITSATGYTNALNGHGASVASLMVADHDGQGVMGIAPNASVVSYNPFDQSGTAGWADVHTGIVALQAAGASVMNMSLGVGGWTLHSDWKDALANVNSTQTVFVLAAGNNGVTQTSDIAWNWTQNPALIVVGSVNPQGQISTFSNKPGAACLLDNGVCSTGHHLYDRFMVAPGELILVADGQGGVTRRSGTSFSAPLVSGAITLLHDRWPWLKTYPQETANILLQSAHDMGAPGPDAVYGWGVLDVEASQSPLNFAGLTFYEYKDGVATQKTAAAVKAAGMQTSWEADGVFFYLYETVGATHRDFAVPMSKRLVGQKSNVGGTDEYFQGYITSRLTGWINGANFSDTATHVAQQPGQWSFAVTTALPVEPIGRRDLAQAPHVAVKMTDPTGRFTFNAGHGEGAMVFGQMPGFAETRDYRGSESGLNPLLGFASGGAFAGAEVALTDRTTLSFGGTERKLVHARNPELTDLDRDLLRNVDDYHANAATLRLTHQVTDELSLSASYAKVREANGFLGVQSLEPGDLRHGASSQVLTLGASLELPHGMTFSGSASSGKTRTAGDQTLGSVGDVLTSAYAVSFAKQGLIGDKDLFKVALTQPLHIERGQMSYTGVEVIDRLTGEIGPVTRTFNIANAPRQVAEALYATPVMKGRGELSLFGRAEFQSGEPIQQYMIGARLNLNY